MRRRASTPTLLAALCLATSLGLSGAFTPISTRCSRTRYGTAHRILPKRPRLSSSSDDPEEVEEDGMSTSDMIFWAKQKAMAAAFEAQADESLRRENREKFAKRRQALTSDTFYFSVLIASALWIVAPNPFVTISYLFGALLGTAYSFGLGKYVESIGASVDDEEAAGAGVGQARFAFLILLVVFVGKFRSAGLLEIPSIMGFFTYQLASLGQGLRQIDD
ncbi:hypothetical protein THAOC_32076 [Thalassiosira oceanica]|uniref:ATP synthase protein I n=1 Tax=Thalassiosira oceanica TaxID=159749 RepID=K0RQT8_THAOC|nr:hypothetical protein THAOC_32076 [Thalassiosira oceanica]|eukprot:EJK49082.1 hypothetical protein THAOC_32076 [Thalassiosira oceanica]